MATNKLNAINDLAIKVANVVRLKSDYRKYLDGSRKLMIVEGATDKVFVNQFAAEYVDCIVASDINRSNNVFHRTTATDGADKFNAKNSIVALMVGVCNYPSPFVKYPNDLDKWKIYGMVDADAEELQFSRPPDKLFITDTHDLETLLISTDPDVFSRIKECMISADDLKHSLFLADQLAFCREQLFDEFKPLNEINCGSREVDFSSFVEDNRINLYKLVAYIIEVGGSGVGSTKGKKIADGICKSKDGKKKLTPSGLWKQTPDSFDYTQDDELWAEVNGHDVLEIIRYSNADAYEAFKPKSFYALNREFEFKLVAVYDYSKLATTQLYKNMLAHGLVSAQ